MPKFPQPVAVAARFIGDDDRPERDPLVRSIDDVGIQSGTLQDVLRIRAQLHDQVAESLHVRARTEVSTVEKALEAGYLSSQNNKFLAPEHNLIGRYLLGSGLPQ